MQAFSPFRLTRPLILASASPRRHELLAGLGVPFTVVTAPDDEPAPLPQEVPEAYARRAAAAKVAAVARLPLPEGCAVLGADTIVVAPEEAARPDAPRILGKPASRDEALAMLCRLVGRTHEVVTACCLGLAPQSPSTPWTTIVFHDVSRVTFAPWPVPVLRAYADSGEPDDKAGAYAVQGLGAFLVARLEGSWSTVVGLPVSLVAEQCLKAKVLLVAPDK